MKSYDFVEIEVVDMDSPLDEAPVFKVEFERRTDWSVDNDYGADADGRRGCRMVFIDEDEAQDIFVDGKPIEAYPAEFQAIIRKAVDVWMAEHEPEFSS